MDKKNNTGEENSGYGNSGDWNSGYGNSGDWNSGDWNSGNRNSGYGNLTNRESGIFCSEEGTVRLFNKPSKRKWSEIDHPHFLEFYLTKWITEDDMTDAEKAADPMFYVRKGQLKIFTNKEAWANFWRDTDEDNRKKILNLPNFDADVFKDITGIDVAGTSLSGKKVKVEVDGQSYTATIDWPITYNLNEPTHSPSNRIPPI